MSTPSALDVRCPICNRMPDFQCQNLSGFASARAWFREHDASGGGFVGYPEKARPHAERVAAAKAGSEEP